MILKIVEILYLSVFAHELGHFIVARLLNLKIVSVSIFMRPFICIFLNGTLYKIGFIPITGYVNVPDIYTQSKWKKIIYFSAGIIMNTSLLLFSNDVFLQTINLYLILFNLLPFRKSDGRNILEVL
ncbi:MAG: site-2 protease family protein [Bacteroidota bacterium]